MDKCKNCINLDPAPRNEHCLSGCWSRQTTGFLTTDEDIEKLINEPGVCVKYFEKVKDEKLPESKKAIEA